MPRDTPAPKGRPRLILPLLSLSHSCPNQGSGHQIVATWLAVAGLPWWVVKARLA